MARPDVQGNDCLRQIAPRDTSQPGYSIGTGLRRWLQGVLLRRYTRRRAHQPALSRREPERRASEGPGRSRILLLRRRRLEAIRQAKGLKRPPSEPQPRVRAPPCDRHDGPPTKVGLRATPPRASSAWRLAVQQRKHLRSADPYLVRRLDCRPRW